MDSYIDFTEADRGAPALRPLNIPPERSGPEQIRRETTLIATSELMRILMEISSGLVAVLDEHRQILAVNHSMMASIGLEDADSVVGLRPGEALGCVHSDKGTNGCGSSQACASCGAVVAIVGSLAKEMPVENRCCLRAVRSGVEREYCFKIKASPLAVGESRFVLLYLQDITQEERRAALERVFFHDVSNVVTALSSAAYLAGTQDPVKRATGLRELGRLSDRLVREIALQRVLVRDGAAGWEGNPEEIEHSALWKELSDIGKNHPAGKGKTLLMMEGAPARSLRTDYALLLRILSNMVINALEASAPGAEINVDFAEGRDSLTYSVRNPGEIPDEVKPRIFQRHFSTKGGSGRGLGTFSMKLLGEDYLGGKVGFETGSAGTTRFWLELPYSR
jgi:PAS domain-containing protein